MNKKIVWIAALGSVLIGSVGASASVNGDYKGNPIVQVRVNGNVLSPEVPAQIVDGSTLLPLRAVSEALGADIKWNPDSYSVDVSAKGNGADPQADLERVKLYSKVADHYRRLGLLLEMAAGISDRLNNTYLAIERNAKVNEQLDKSVDYVNTVLDTYNAFLQPNEEVIAAAAAYNVDITDTRTMLNDAKASLELYKSSLSALVQYAQTKSKSKLDQYADYNLKGFDQLKESRNLEVRKYDEYYTKVQTY